MAKVLLAAATLAQLTTFASTNLGLEIPDSPKPSKASLLALISSTFSGEEIDVAYGEETGSSKGPITVADIKGRKMVRINIPVQEGIAGGSDAVPVGVNGTVSRIMRGVDVDVPVEYVEVLQNAEKMVPVKDQDSKIVGWTAARIYPFSILAVVA